MKKTQVVNESLRRARLNKRLTQKELAEKIGAGESSVRSWEKKTRWPGPEYLDRLCAFLEQSPEELDLLPPIEEPPLSPSKHSDAKEKEREENEVSKPSKNSRTLHTFDHIPTSSSDKNRDSLLRRVQSRWITSVLDKLCSQLIPLRLVDQLDAVASPWLAEARPSSAVPEQPSENGIIRAYDDAEGELLILGEAGAGKSTLLLKLVREFVRRANQDKTHPIPIIFHLPTWKQRQWPIIEWMIEELNANYQVPLELAQEWVEQDQILPLLDGLDELPANIQTSCIEMINQYRLDHGLVSLVICSQPEDYFAQPARLILNSAVMIQPLSSDQIDAYLTSHKNESFMPILEALHTDSSLTEMASTPLMINVITEAYQERSLEEIRAIDRVEERRHMIFQQYVSRVLQRKKRTDYTVEQTEHWLTWLAQHMQRDDQTEFYLERMQPDWLEKDQRPRYHHTVTRIVYGANLLILGGLYGSFRSNANRAELLGWMIPGLGALIHGEANLALIVFISSIIIEMIVSHQNISTISWSVFRYHLWERLRHGCIKGFIAGDVAGTLLSLAAILINALFRQDMSKDIDRSISYGIALGFLVMISVALVNILSVHPNDDQQHAHPSIGERLKNHLAYFACGTIGMLVVYSTLDHHISTMSMILALIIGTASTLIGLGNMTEYLYPGIGQNIQPAEMVTWSWYLMRRRLRANIIKGFFMMCIIAIPMFLVLGGISGLFYGLFYGLRYGLIYGSIVSVVNGMAFMLTAILNSGWSSSILDDKHLNTPNEGIHNSWRHALFAASVFGIVGGVLSGVTSGVSFWIGGIPGWPTLMLEFTLIFSVIFAFWFWMAYGGMAVIEHYVLRWYLYRADSLPWRYTQFLDYAVEHSLLRKIGGGYMFTHRLLQEHFVQMNQENHDQKSSRRRS